MGKLRGFYNQNRYMIWIIILVILAIIILIQVLDNFVSEKNNNEIAVKQNTVINNSNDNFDEIDENYSVITGQDVNKEVSQIIDEFINYCNNKEIEKAYELLSIECKEILYPTIEDFNQKYYKRLFSGNTTYLYQSWITNNNYYTYKVDFIEDMLATGKTASSSIIDYYTVVKNNNEYKLNINKFIGIEDINKSETKNNIKVLVKRKRIYMDYETYEIEVKNNSKEKVMLDSLKKTNKVYIEDEEGQKYYWYNHEIIEEDVLIRKAQQGNLEIKFNKPYKPTRKAIKVVFANVLSGENNIIKIEIFL